MKHVVTVLLPVLVACATDPTESPTGRSLEAVVHSELPPPAIQGGTLAIGPGFIAAASDPDRGHIWLVDLRRGIVRAKIDLDIDDLPGRVLARDDGGFFVVLRGAGEIAHVSPAGELERRQPVCANPEGVARQDAALHVACAGGELVTLPVDGGAPTRRVLLARDLRDVVVTENHLLVSRFRSAEVLVVDADGAVERTLEPPRVQETEPGVAWRMVSDGIGGAVMVHQRASVDGKFGHGAVQVETGGYGGGPDPCSSAIVEAALTHFTPDRVVGGVSISGAVLPVDVAVWGMGGGAGDIAVAAAGNLNEGDEAFRIPAVRQLDERAAFQRPGIEPVIGDFFRSPPAPRVGTFCGDRGIPLMDGRQAVATAFNERGQLVVQTRDPWTIMVREGNTIPLLSDDMKDSGHDLFHEDTGGGIACASCHPGGGDDGQVWTFEGFGDRRTQNLAGGLMGTAPFHWEGDMADFDMLVREVFSGRMGGPALPREHSTALATWIDTIPAPPAGTAADPAAVERGKAVFERSDTECLACHSGALLSNNTTVDVGTGRLLQVPPLVGLGVRAPYMHTGCAETMVDRFNASCGGGDAHGITSHLTTEEVADLSAYLETL
ncbi:MAG: cytochrome c [Myxococcota bacterium]